MKKTNYLDNLKKYGIMSMALLMNALAFNLFLRKTHIVAGGINGVGIIGEKLLKVDASIIIFICSALFLLLSYIFLDKKNTVAGIYATIFYPFIVYITSSLSNLLDFDGFVILLAVLLAGIINGICNGIIFRIGLNNGGIGIVSKIIDKGRRLNLANINFVLNVIIVIIGMFVFELINIVYACIYLYLSNIFTKMLLKKKDSELIKS